MKREALSHTKMRRLCRVLKLRPYEAVGIMESIWHMVSREAPAGDIGKLSDDDIADAIGWDREGSELVNGLVQSGWVDKHPEHRLIVHDWPEHCEDSVHLKLARSRRLFACGTMPKTAKLQTGEREQIMPELNRLFLVRNPESVRTASARQAHDISTSKTPQEPTSSTDDTLRGTLRETPKQPTISTVDTYGGANLALPLPSLNQAKPAKSSGSTQSEKTAAARSSGLTKANAAALIPPEAPPPRSPAAASPPPDFEALATKYPKARARILARFPGADAMIVGQIAAKALQEYPGIGDEDLAFVIKSVTKSDQRSIGLYLQTVPEFIRSEQARTKAVGA